LATAETKHTLSGGTSGELFTDRRNFYLDPTTTAELWASVNPFLVFSTKLGIRDVPDSDFKLFEHRADWPDNMKYYVNAVTPPAWSGTNAITVTIDNGSGSAPDYPAVVGQELEIRDAATGAINAVAVVTAVNSSTSIDIKPLSSSPTNLGDNDVLNIIGDAQEEGSGSPTAVHDELTHVWNSTGIFKTPVAVTGSLLKASLRGYSSELERLRLLKLQEHAVKKERALLFSVRSGGNSTPAHVTGAGGMAIRTTHGLRALIDDYGDANNKFALSYSTFKYDNFVDNAEKIFKYVNAGRTKFAFAGAGVIGFFSKVSSGGFLGNTGVSINFNVDRVPTAFGFEVNELITPFGRLLIAWDPVLRGDYNDTMFVVDPENVFIAQYRPDEYQTAIQNPDADLVKDQYFSDMGLGLTLVETHSKWAFS